MSSITVRGLRCGILLLASGTILTTGALAQNRTASPPGAVVQPLDSGPGAQLRQDLSALAANPRSAAALIGAGRASLAMGDAEAALNFFARADDADPRNPRAKAGMASALVQLERANEALPLFAEAIRLGAPETEIAGDRGLAHDMLGDPRRAQADYALALRGGEDFEIQRRLALSLAISGQREAALRVIDGQLRNHDRAGWRTQAFVLALTGDAAGATRTAREMMPTGAAELAPFFARLANLSPAQKAAAVHFGRFPSNGRPTTYAARDISPDPSAMAMARNDPPRPRPRPAEPISGRPDRSQSFASREPLGPIAPAARRPDPPAVEPHMDEVAPDEPQSTPLPPEEQPVSASAQNATAGFTLVPSGTQPSFAAPATSAPIGSRLGDLAAVVAALPADEEAARPAPVRSRPTRPTRTAEAQTTPSRRTTSRSRPAAPPNPSRHWVQIAGGANRSGLPVTFARLRALAPALLGGRPVYSTPVNQTNRLLVGPFDSSGAAQAFVNQLADKNVPAFAWTSLAGQEIDRLQIANETRSTRARSEPERPAARNARGRSQPEPRPAARGRRTH